MKLIDVMNGWRDAPHYWWRYLLFPWRIEKCAPLGWTSVSAFGFVFFFEHKLSPQNQKIVRENGRKLLEWVKKNGERGD